MSDAGPIAYEVTLITPEMAASARRRRRIRRAAVVAALSLAVIAPSPLTAIHAHPFHSAYCYAVSC